MYSTITTPKRPIPKRNPRQQAKRKAGYRKLLAGKEYKAARAEAMARAMGQCEQHFQHSEYFTGGITLTQWRRCANVGDLHAHHLRYPKSRPLAARDLMILCRYHHEQAEILKPHKTRMY
jgi:hypothetical protein